MLWKRDHGGIGRDLVGCVCVCVFKSGGRGCLIEVKFKHRLEGGEGSLIPREKCFKQRKAGLRILVPDCSNQRTIRRSSDYESTGLLSRIQRNLTFLSVLNVGKHILFLPRAY